MLSKAISLLKIKNETFSLEKTSPKINLSKVFAKREYSYLNELTLFIAHFNEVPNFIEEIKIDCKKAVNWFIETYSIEIKNLHYSKRYLCWHDKKPDFDDIYFSLYEDLMVYFDINKGMVKFLFRKTEIEKIEAVVAGLRKFKYKGKRNPKIYLLVNSDSGLDTKSFRISKPKLNIEDNYNDDFKEIHQIILKRLGKKNDKGIVLLHGKPGTGKTSYIRYLVAILKKKVIFLPSTMANALTDPGLIGILKDNTNSVFVIEDAENIILTREQAGNSPVSALLNITDGLLADCLNIQVICSFNTDLTKVDSALMRKGRLIANYEFKELETHQAQKLSDKLGFKTTVNKPMSLTDIYNQDEKDFYQARNSTPIGFGLVNSN